VYLSSILRHRERLTEIERRCLLVQFGGAAGTLASLADNGIKVRQELAKELDLIDPDITWHVARDTIAEIINYLALVGGSLGKIAYDIMIMSSNEFGEVSEPFMPYRGASSTMPQKRNPISSEIVLATSKLLRSNAGLGLDAMVADFERASGPWHLEWFALPEAFVLTVGALHQTNFMMAGLVVNVDTMSRNLESSQGLIVGEAVMMGLAPMLGRQKAHEVVYEACRIATDKRKPLRDVLKEQEPILATGIDDDTIARLCDPLNYMGASQSMSDCVCRTVG
jgi:3-carboxy-cis,cis-muconate cycloisomerase